MEYTVKTGFSTGLSLEVSRKLLNLALPCAAKYCYLGGSGEIHPLAKT